MSTSKPESHIVFSCIQSERLSIANPQSEIVTCLTCGYFLNLNKVEGAEGEPEVSISSPIRTWEVSAEVTPGNTTILVQFNCGQIVDK